MKAVLTPAAQPCRYPCSTLGAKFNVLVLAAAGNKSATRPPLPTPRCGGEWKETGRNLVGRDKGSLREQQTKGTGTMIHKRGIHRKNRHDLTEAFSRTGVALHATELF